jgi:hypothetical protein
MSPPICCVSTPSIFDVGNLTSLLSHIGFNSSIICYPCGLPKMLSQAMSPTLQSQHNQCDPPKMFTDSPITLRPRSRRYFKFPNLQLWYHLLDCTADSDSTRYIHESVFYYASVHQDLQQKGIGTNSTQKTNLVSEGFPTYFVVLSHHQFWHGTKRNNQCNNMQVRSFSLDTILICLKALLMSTFTVHNTTTYISSI